MDNFFTGSLASDYVFLLIPFIGFIGLIGFIGGMTLFRLYTYTRLLAA